MEIVGIDWGRKKHYCYLLHEGKKLVLNNKEEDFAKLLKIKEAIYVIEDGNNRIVDYLLRNNRQVYMLSSRRSSEARSFFVIEGKSDFIDSKVIAMTYEHNPNWCFQVKREGIACELDVLVEEIFVLNKSMMQDVGRLDAYLERYWPEIKEVFEGTSVRKMALISICPTAKDLLSISEKELIRKLKEMNVRIDSDFRKKLKELRKIAVERYVPASTRKLIIAFSRHAMEKKVMKEEIGRQMKKTIEKSQYKVLLTIPGLRVTTATASSCFPGPQGRAQPDLVVDLFTILRIGDIHAVGQHAVKTPVILDQARRVCPCNFPDGLFNRIRRDVRIDILKRGLESSDQYDLIVIITFTGRAACLPRRVRRRQVWADVRAKGGLPA